MSKLLVVPLLALAGLAASVGTATAQDRDHDGLPDRWERRYGLSTAKKSSGADPDHDHLRNRREYRLRLNPRRADTDRDGLRDRAELVRWRTNPRRADTDGDGFKDGAEVRAGTNPRNPRSFPRFKPLAPPAPAPAGGFPTPSTTGVPAGWAPAQTRSTDLRVTQAGGVVEDVLLTSGADLLIEAPNVTVRRVVLQGGKINNQPGSGCANGLLIEDTTLEPPPGQNATTETEAVVSYGGYTARRVKIWQRSEGFRVSGKSAGCGPVRIEDSFARIDDSDNCDLHADGIQGYNGSALTVVNTTIDGQRIGCGTAPFFYPRNQGNTRADVNGLLVMGAGYPFRLGTPGTVSGLRIVNGSWEYGPINVACSLVTAWDASLVTITANYQVASTVQQKRCDTQDGN